MNRALLCLLLVLLAGCSKSGENEPAELVRRYYLRYVEPDAPPIEELYHSSEDGFLLKQATYDSNGDWMLDKRIIFSDHMDSLHFTVKNISNPFEKVFPRTEIRTHLELSLDPKQVEIWLTEPPQSAANEARHTSEPYLEAQRTVVEFSKRWLHNKRADADK